jgi:hypothetical protein
MLRLLEVLTWIALSVLLVVAWYVLLLAGLALLHMIAWVLVVLFNDMWRVELFVLLMIAWVLAVRYRDFWQDLYSIAITYTGLLALIVLMYLIVYGLIGTSYGVQRLFWSEELPVRLSSSAAATIFLALVGTIIFDLDPHPLRTARRLKEFRRTESRREDPGAPISYENCLVEFLHVARWPFLVLLALPALLPDVFSRVPRVVPFYMTDWPHWNAWFEKNVRPTSFQGHAFGYVFGLAVWIAGIALGVVIFESLIALSVLTHDPNAQRPDGSGGRSSRSLASTLRAGAKWSQVPVELILSTIPVVAWWQGRLESAWAVIIVALLVAWSLAGALRRWKQWSAFTTKALFAVRTGLGVLTIGELVLVWSRGQLASPWAFIVGAAVAVGSVRRSYVREKIALASRWFRSWWSKNSEIVRVIAGLVLACLALVLWGVGGINSSWGLMIIGLVALGTFGESAWGWLDRLMRERWRWTDRAVSESYVGTTIQGCHPSAQWEAGVAIGGGVRRRTCPLQGCPADQPAPHEQDLGGCLVKRERLASLDNLLFWFIVFCVLSATVFYEWFSPSAAICLLLGVLAMAVAWVSYRRPRRKLVYFLGLVAYIGLVNNQVYKDRFEHMDAYYSSPVILRDKADFLYKPSVSPVYATELEDPDVKRAGKDADLVDNELSLEAWRAGATGAWSRAAKPLAKPKMVIVSVSGGATRSAYWTALVLEALSKILDGQPPNSPTFAPSIRVITGTSGGMVGAAYFVERQYRDRVGATPEKRSLVEQLPVDTLNSLASYIMLRDLPRSLFPRLIYWRGPGGWVEEFDRGTILEKSWDYLRDRALQDYANEEKRGEIPSLILAPMMVEDGRLLLITNLDLSSRPLLQSILTDQNLPLGLSVALRAGLTGPPLQKEPMVYTRGSKITEDQDGSTIGTYSLFGLEFFKLFPKATDFRVATAVRMNATFPFVSPAVSLPTEPPRQVVDAGYFDNYGVQVSSAWIHMNRRWLIQNTSGVLLVQIRDGLSVLDRWEIDDRDPSKSDRIAQGYQFLLSPIQGAANARSTTGMFRNDNAVEHLSEWFTLATGRRGFFTTITVENPAGIGVVTAPRDRTKLPGQDLVDALGGEDSLIDVLAKVLDSQPGIDTRLDARKSLSRKAETKMGIEYQLEDITMSWFLSRAETVAMSWTLPDPNEDEGARETPGDAVKRLRQKRLLENLIMILKNSPRDYALRELVKIRNYARIVQLKDKWWYKDFSPSPAATAAARRSTASP